MRKSEFALLIPLMTRLIFLIQFRIYYPNDGALYVGVAKKSH